MSSTGSTWPLQRALRPDSKVWPLRRRWRHRDSIPGHDEELSDHAGPLADVLLHQLRARDADEGAVCVVGHSSSQQGLPRACRILACLSLIEGLP